MTESLKVALIGPLPPPIGGMATQTQQLRSLLLQEGLQVELVQTNAPYRPGWIGAIGGLRALFRLIPYLWSAWRAVGVADVVHLMSNSGWSWQLYSAPVIWICRLRHTPCIVNYRGGEARSYFRKSLRWVRPSLLAASERVVPSGFLQAVFVDFGIPAKVIPNIIDLQRFRPPDTADKTPGSRYRLIITRNLEAIYGIGTAITAFSLLRKEIPDAELCIAGSGPQLQELQALVAELQLENYVHFVGKLGPDAITRLYQSADLLLNPTTVDNMPNSVLEALASGVVVVTTDVGGIPFIVQHEETALLVPVDEPDAMAAQVIRALTDAELRTRLIENGRKSVEKYAWPVVKSDWLDLYRSLAGAG